jgi:hypothetical protein
MARTIRQTLLTNDSSLELLYRSTTPTNTGLSKLGLESSLVTLNSLAKRMSCRRSDALFGEQVVVNEQESEKR